MPAPNWLRRTVPYAAGCFAAALMVLAVATTASGLPVGGELVPTTSTTLPILGGTIDSVLAPVTTIAPATTTTTTSTTRPPAAPAATTTTVAPAQAPAAPAPPPDGAKGAAAPAPAPAGSPLGGPNPPVLGSAPVAPQPPDAATLAGAAAALPGEGRAGPSLVLAGRPDSVMFAEGANLPRLSQGRSTAPILDQLAGLALSPSVLARILAPFPVAGPATYTDDWEAVRLTPAFHLHQGTDIFAARGTPVIASDDGVVSQLTADAGAGGISLRLTISGGSFFYYAHLERLSPTVREGKQVRRGDVVGFVGATGDARGGPPHLHYQIHPGGRSPVNPIPYLDRWLADAAVTAASVARAPEDVAQALAARKSGGVAIPSGAAGRASGMSAGSTALELGGIRPISSHAAGPFGVVVMAMVAVVLHQRSQRRRRSRRRAALRAGPPAAVPMPPAPAGPGR